MKKKQKTHPFLLININSENNLVVIPSERIERAIIEEHKFNYTGNKDTSLAIVQQCEYSASCQGIGIITKKLYKQKYGVSPRKAMEKHWEYFASQLCSLESAYVSFICVSSRRLFRRTQ